MKKKYLMSICTYASFALAFLALSACDLSIGEPKQIIDPLLFSRYPESGYYKIDSTTILNSIVEGEGDIFTPLLEDPGEIESSGMSYLWTQSDYMKITEALGELVWDDGADLQDWQMYDLLFVKSCQDDLHGYQSSRIVYFKPADVGGMYTTRFIEVVPYNNYVRWAGGTLYRMPLTGWENVDPADAKIAAEDALQIAEQNGGAETRREVQNFCSVYVSPTADGKWHVEYLGTDFEVYIDYITGEYQIPSKSQ